jgi:hypothetical protein
MVIALETLSFLIDCFDKLFCLDKEKIHCLDKGQGNRGKTLRFELSSSFI